MSLLSRVRHLLKPAPTPIERVRPDYIRWDGLRTGWGFGVYWHSGLHGPIGVGPIGSLSGFDPIRDPRIGDVFYTAMQSGRTLLWVVDKVESVRDPADMYHADVTRLGYEDEVDLPPSTWVEPGGFRFLRGG